jgi:protein-S-isoprenylcysteine O-methyltransferase Ste14
MMEVARLNSHAPWWKGTRGEWYVVTQGFLFALVAFGPRTLPGLPTWAQPYAGIASAIGLALMLAGGALAVAGLIGLGQKNLTALPYPRDESTLVVTGPYRLVRNPIYSGLSFGAFGYALWVNSWLTLGYAALLFAFFDIKSRKEERWLAEKFSDYPAYQKRVRKLIPWVY